MSTVNILFIILSFMGFVLVFIPLPWHYKARNIGTCLFMAWIGLGCLVLGINSIVWDHTTADLASYWCDISTKFMVGALAAVSTVSLCINLRLFLIATDRARVLEKRRLLVLELVLGLGFPFIEMGLQYVVQGHRFDIYGGVGCHPVFDNVLLAYLLIQGPQLLFGLISIIFCVLTMFAYFRYFNPSQSPHTLSDSFVWFLTLGGLTALSSVGYNTFVVYLKATTSIGGPFVMWMTWGQMHSNFSLVKVYTEAEWRSNIMVELMLEIDRWIFVGLAFLFFAFLGFTHEARRRYITVLSVCFRRKFSRDTKSSSWGAAQPSDLSASNSAFDWKISSMQYHPAPRLLEDPYPMANPYPMKMPSVKRFGTIGVLPIPLNLPPSITSSSSLLAPVSSSPGPTISANLSDSQCSFGSIYSQNDGRQLLASPSPSPLSSELFVPRTPPAVRVGPIENTEQSEVFQGQTFIDRATRALTHGPSDSFSSLQVPTVGIQRSRSGSTGSVSSSMASPTRPRRFRSLSRSSSANSVLMRAALGPPLPEPSQPLPPEPSLQPPNLPFVERKPRPVALRVHRPSVGFSTSSIASNRSFLNVRRLDDAEASLARTRIVSSSSLGEDVVVGVAF